jgi:hypothetical protein
VADGYKSPATPLKYRDGKKLEENDSRDRNAIANGVTQLIHTKIMHLLFCKRNLGQTEDYL